MPPAPQPPTITSLTCNPLTRAMNFSYAQSGSTSVKYKVNDGSYITFGTVSTGGTVSLFNLTANVVYTVTLVCTNAQGSVTATASGIPYDVPSDVVIGTITSTQPNTLTIPFTYNSNSSDITRTYYIIEPSGSVTTSVPTPGSYFTGVPNPFDLSGLTTGTYYYVRLVLKNAAGSSVMSANAVGRVANIPTQVVIGTITSTIANTLTVPYTYNNNGSALTDVKYIIEASGAVTATAPNISAGTANPFNISGLTAGTTYYVRILATNAIGNSTVSANAIGTAKNVPTQVVVGTITSTVANTLTVPYTYKDNGSALTDVKYIIEASGAVTATAPNISVGTTNPFTISGLTAGTTYYVRILATNAIGNSTVSVNAIGIVKNVPSNVVIGTITSTTSSTLTVPYTYTENGSPMNSAKYIIEPSGSVTNTAPNISIGKTNPFTISGLTAGTTYYVRMLLINDIGNSAVSANAIGTVANVPTNVVIGNMTSTKLNTITVPYTYNANGLSITNVKYIVEPSGSVTTTVPNISVGTTNPFEITGLTGGVAYYVRILLTNSLGNSAVSANQTCVVIDVPTQPVISSIGTDTLDTLDINYTSSYYGPDSNVLTAYSDYTNNKINSRFTTGTTIIPPNSFANISNIPNWEIRTDASSAGAVYIGNGSTIYASSPPSNIQQYAILSVSNSTALASIRNYLYFKAGDYQFVYTAYRQKAGNGDILNLYMYNASIPNVYTAVVLDDSTPYDSVWGEYNIGFNIPTSGSYAFIIKYTSTNTSAFPNTISITNAYILNGITPANPTKYTDAFNNYKTLPLYTSLANNSSTSGLSVSGWNMSSLYIAKGTTTYATAASGEGYIVLGNNTNHTLAETAYDGTLVITFSACTKYANSYYDILTLWNGTAQSKKQVKIKTTSWATYTERVNFALLPSSHPEYTPYNNGRQLQFMFNTTNPTQPNYVSIKDVVITPISLYVPTNLSIQPPLSITRTGFLTYPISVMIHNKTGGRSLLSAPVNATAHSVPSTPVITGITCTVSKQLNIFWNSIAPIGTTISSVQYSVNGGSFTSAGISNPIVVPNLSGGILYSFNLKTTNIYGTSLPSDACYGMPIDRLYQPIITDITEPSNNTIAVYWKDDLNDLLDDINGLVIAEIKYSLDNGETYTSAGTQNPIILTGLTGGVLYPVKIIASNPTNGDSIESSVSYGMPYSTPGRPQITSITATEAKKLNVFWTNATNGADITAIKYSLDGSTPSISGILANPLVIDNLTGGTTYQISIITTNLGGNSLQSYTYTATPYDVPSKPTITDVVYVNHNYYVSWTDSSNGADITSIKYSLDGSDPSISVGTTNPFSIGDLSSGYTYPLKIQAINSAGGSIVSDTYTINATGGGSGLPTLNINTPSILDVSGNDKSIQVYFQHTETVGYPVITYQYQLNNNQFINSESSSSPLVIRNLENGNIYSVKMTAINATGTSSISNQSVNVMPHSVPNRPILSHVDASSSKLICYIERANNNGGTSIQYKYSVNDSSYSLPSQMNTDISNNKIIIDELENGVSYNVSVKQVNEYGDSSASNVILGCVPYGAPFTPEIVSVSVNATDATISFSHAISNGYPIIMYEYTITGGSTYIPIPAELSANNFTILGLTPSTTYLISIRAKNQMGLVSLPSSPYMFKTGSIVPAPVITEVVPGNGSMTINFLNGNLQGGYLFGYSYSINSGTYQSLTMLDENVGDTSIVINGLTNGNIYSVSLKTVANTGISVPSNTINNIIPYGSPDSPTIINVSVISKQATVYFEEGQTNGYPIIKIEYSLDNGETFITAPTLTSPFTIYDLTDGTQYTVKLRATHEKASSTLSVGYDFTPSDIPSPPTIYSVVPGNQKLEVFYTEGPLNGGVFQNFAISINGGIYTNVSESDISGNCITVNNLTNGTSYSIAMKTATTKGTSSASLTVNGNIPFDVPSSPIITAVSVSSGQATISFTQESSNGYPILGYKYSLDGTNYINAPGSTSSPITIYGFTDGISNTLLLKAYHAKGISSASNSITFTTGDSPNSPTIVSVVGGNGTLTANFINGNLNGGEITGYLVSVNGSSYTQVSNSDIIDNSIIIRNLTNGSSYNIAMKTITNIGTSAASNTVYNNIPFTTPSAPTITNVITSDKTANIIFTAGQANGYPILGYKVSINSADYINATWDTSSSEIIIQGLTNGVSTTVSIRSYSSVGESSDSNTYTFTISQMPDEPTITNAVAGDSMATIEFQNNNLYGGSVVKYSYSLDRVVFTDVSSSDISGNTITIHGLTNGESYSISIKVTTEIGTSLESNIKSNIIPFTAPTEPVISYVTAGNKMATVSFQPSISYSMEYDIINYQYSLDGGNTYIWCSSIIDNSFEIIGLTPKVQYSVILRGYSKIGFSANSAPSSQFTPFGVPNTPVITSAVPSNQQILLYLDTPESNGNEITSYLYSVNGGEYLSTSDVTSPITITGLTNGTSYKISLKAVNLAGSSDTSLPSQEVIPFHIPDTPIISGVRPNNNSAIIDLSSTNLNGDTIIGYKYSFDQEVWYDSSALSNSQFSFLINGLTNGTAYTIYTKIVSQSGITAASSISQSFVPRNVPNPPTITSVVPADKAILVYFTDSSSNGSAIKEYWYSASGSPYVLALQHTSPITVYGLTNGQTYNIKLKAVNDAGFSAESVASLPVMPFGVPATPFISNIYPGNKSATVYFNEINANGVPIEKIQYSMGQSWIDLSANSSPFVIPNLTNKTGPSISIRAKNGAGYSYQSNIVRVIVGTPYPPTITNVIAGNKQATVHFNINQTNAPLTAVYYSFVGISSAPIKAIGLTSPIVVPRLVNGTSYSIKLQLANLNGYSLVSAPSAPVVPAGVPNKLFISSVERSGLNQMKIHISPPLNNGSPIIKYYYSINSSTTLNDISGLTPPFVINNLSPNVAYSFKLYSENAVGISPESAPSRTVVNVYTPPAAPSEISVIATFGQLSVSFEPPLTPLFLPITTYLYCLNGTGSSSDVYTNLNTTEIPLNIPISNNTNYSVRIKAANIAGSSPASAPTTPVSYIYLPPTYPSIKSIATVGNGTVYVSYTPSNTRNSPITGYAYTLNSGQTYVEMEMSGSILIATGLTNNTPISTFKIAANSDVGYSNLSMAAPSFTVTNGPPSPPVITSYSLSGRIATIKFTAASTNGAPIIDYTYTVSNITRKTTVSTTTTNTTISLPNLQNGSYSFTVKARNSYGISDSSPTRTFIVNVV